MHEGKNLGIMTTLKKTYPRKGSVPPLAETHSGSLRPCWRGVAMTSNVKSGQQIF
jgi:hypothetical protein